MKLRELLLGLPRNPLDPKVFERIALAALLAWVGLGADGLSSSCYGPEEIFLSLGPYRALIPFLILAVVVTVGVLSWGYAYTIEAFPGGGGGYVVASKTLGRYPGLLCGCALLVDYVLTIAMSLASGIDALFSTLPGAAQPLKLPATILIAAALMLLNLRGVKESILALLPIFLGFILTHTVAIVAALVTHAPQIGSALREARTTASSMSLGALLLILLKSFTAGAGTYTGIEAVSNSVPILREPRVATAKRAMLYMAVSLSFVSGGILLGYLLYAVQPQPGRTLNAVLLERILEGSPLAGWFVPLTLLTEGALLFVAAQAGYVSGPRALASMAVDSWVPRWFRRLNDRLVTSNGVILISIGAILAVILTGGRVQVLVMVYAFSVFVTFVLSQFGMCLYQARHREPGWIFRLSVNGSATLLSLAVAASLAVFHWGRGVWAAVLVLLVLMLTGMAVQRYYRRIGRLLGRLDGLISRLESEPPRGEPPPCDPSAPTAVLLVRGYNGPGLHTLMTILHLFPNYFRNFVFLSVGDIDFDRFKGVREVQNLKDSVEADLRKYVALARKWGFHAESRTALGVDVVEEIAQLCPALMREFPRAIFFAGQLIYEEPTFINRLLHDQTGEMIQRRLQFEGLAVLMLPIRILRPRRPA